MHNISQYIIEKLIINKDSESYNLLDDILEKVLPFYDNYNYDYNYNIDNGVIHIIAKQNNKMSLNKNTEIYSNIINVLKKDFSKYHFRFKTNSNSTNRTWDVYITPKDEKK